MGYRVTGERTVVDGVSEAGERMGDDHRTQNLPCAVVVAVQSRIISAIGLEETRTRRVRLVRARQHSGATAGAVAAPKRAARPLLPSTARRPGRAAGAPVTVAGPRQGQPRERERERDGSDFYLVKWRCAELKQVKAVTPNECSSCC